MVHMETQAIKPREFTQIISGGRGEKTVVNNLLLGDRLKLPLLLPGIHLLFFLVI